MKRMANECNQVGSCDEAADSHMKRDAQQSNKKKKATTAASSKQLVILPDNDSDYVPIEEPKGSSGRRVWTEKDEIRLLKALKKQSNKSDMMELFNSVEASLEAEVSKTQVSDKVRKLRNKFKKSRVDVGAHLEGHQANVYKLCQQLWGDDGCAAAGGEDRGCTTTENNYDHGRRLESNFVDNYPRMDSRLHHLYPTPSMTGEGYATIIKLMMTYISQEELKALEKKWVDLYLEEIQVIGTKRMRLMEEQLDLIEKAREAHKNQIEN